MEPNTAIPYLLQHTATMMLRQSDQVLLERLGVGMSQFRILAMLEHQPNTQQRKLADRLGQTEASISRQIKLLGEKGFLAVATNPKSKREHITVLTPKGLKITEAAKEVLAAHHQPMLDLLNDKQRKQVADMLAVFHGHVCGPGKPFACDHPFKR